MARSVFLRLLWHGLFVFHRGAHFFFQFCSFSSHSREPVLFLRNLEKEQHSLTIHAYTIT